MTRAQVDAWKQEIIDLRTGHEWEFFTGEFEDLTTFDEIRRRLAELHALIEEHSA